MTHIKLKYQWKRKDNRKKYLTDFDLILAPACLQPNKLGRKFIQVDDV